MAACEHHRYGGCVPAVSRSASAEQVRAGSARAHGEFWLERDDRGDRPGCHAAFRRRSSPGHSAIGRSHGLRDRPAPAATASSSGPSRPKRRRSANGGDYDAQRGKRFGRALSARDLVAATDRREALGSSCEAATSQPTPCGRTACENACRAPAAPTNARCEGHFENSACGCCRCRTVKSSCVAASSRPVAGVNLFTARFLDGACYRVQKIAYG